MRNKIETEENLKKAGFNFCEGGQIWCGAKENKEDYECNNCDWQNLNNKIKEKQI